MRDDRGRRVSDDWTDLENLWRLSPDLDSSLLAKKTKRASRWIRISFAIETMICIGAVAAGGYLMAFDGIAAVSFGCFATLFALGALLATTWIRRGVWGAESNTTEALLDLQIRRARAAIRYALWNLYGCAVALLFIPFGLWMLDEAHPGRWSDDLAAVEWVFGFTLFWTATVAILSLAYKRRKRRELAGLENMLRSLSEEAETPHQRGPAPPPL